MDFCLFPLLTAHCECKCHHNTSTRIAPLGLVPCVQLAVCCFVQLTIRQRHHSKSSFTVNGSKAQVRTDALATCFSLSQTKIVHVQQQCLPAEDRSLRNPAFNFCSISVVRSYHGSHQYLVSTRRAELEQRSIGDPPSSSFLPGQCHIVIRKGWKEKRNTLWPLCHCTVCTPLLLGFSSVPDDLPSTTRSETSKSPAALSSVFPLFTFSFLGSAGGGLHSAGNPGMLSYRGTEGTSVGTALWKNRASAPVPVCRAHDFQEQER